MNNSTHVGMPRYLELLNEARTEGKPVGVKHHLYDKQYKEWAEQNPTPIEAKAEPTKQGKVNKTYAAQITAEDAAVINAELQKIRSRLNAAKKSVAIPSTPQTAVAQQQNAVQSIQDRLNNLKKQKIADALKVDTRVDHIKSAGNGL